MAQYEIRRLLPRHHKILDLAIEGFDYTEIAKLMNMTPVAISYIVNSILFQDELSRRRTGVTKAHDEAAVSHVGLARQMIDEASTRAVEVHEELMDHDDPRVRQTSAKAILDIALGADKTGGQQSSVLVLDASALARLSEALQEVSGTKQIKSKELSLETTEESVSSNVEFGTPQTLLESKVA